MITADAGESSQAVSIEVIGRAFAQWNLPWDLTPLRHTSSGTDTQTIQVRPQDSSATTSSTPAVTGQLCLTLSNGETGIELAASREGQEFRVYSGDCIDLAPGTYVLTEEDSAIFCLPYHVKIAAGQTRYFKLTCR